MIRRERRNMIPLSPVFIPIFLIRIWSGEAPEQVWPYNFNIQPRGPAANIVQVTLNTLSYLLKALGFTAPAVHLRPAGDASAASHAARPAPRQPIRIAAAHTSILTEGKHNRHQPGRTQGISCGATRPKHLPAAWRSSLLVVSA